MTTLAILNSFVAFDTAATLPEVELARAPSRRRVLLVLLLIAWIAVLDLFSQRTNFAILYIAPLFLLARRGDLRYPWQTASLLVGLTYGVYFLKNTIMPIGDSPTYLDYRLVNRSLVTLMILVMARMLELWCRWRADQSDAEIPEVLRYQDQEISATFAVLACIPLAVAIAVIDFFAPASFNLAILYTVPLFVCGWTGSRRLLWCMLVALLALTAMGYFAGGAPLASQEHVASLARNRLLAATGLIVVSVILHFWMSDRDIATA